MVPLLPAELTSPHALIYRPERAADRLELLLGEVCTVTSLADLNCADLNCGELLALVPFRQVIEHGYQCHDDGTPMRALRVTSRHTLTLDEAFAALPDEDIEMIDGDFDVDDTEYSDLVRRIIDKEIGGGAGSNFVIRRSYRAQVRRFSSRTALAMFRRLLTHESGSYWTFLVNTGDLVLIGATPERQVSVEGHTVTMNPISGTLRYPAGGADITDMLAFLADGKETDELYMVLDEELKMMARICEGGGRVIGPGIRGMARVAHTEYHIVGTSSLEPTAILRETLCAPTVTGSPVENAYRVIQRYERSGRGYYSGAIALLERDGAGRAALDSAILIRTAEINPSGRMVIGVGATLVRHSDPSAEVAETRAKVAGLLHALTAPTQRPVGAHTPVGAAPPTAWHPAVQAALAERNAGLAGFWVDREDSVADTRLAGRTVLVVDAEDRFTAMLAHQLRSLGPRVEVRGCTDPDLAHDVNGADLVVVGPGPGDPNDLTDPRIAALRRVIEARLAGRLPLLAVCLGHQVLCRYLGLPVVRRHTPNQGAQHVIDLNGRWVRVGFYNTFVAMSTMDTIQVGEHTVDIARDQATGEVHATRSALFSSVQFHPESVLSEDGVAVLTELVNELLTTRVYG
jgi:2-amino-4-deoxychorismate synthase